MAERSKRIILKVDEKEINKETIKLYKKYKIGMSIKELSEKTIYNYEKDLYSWFSYIHIFQDNKPITEIDEDDLTEYFYYCKGEGNNSRRIKRRMSSISAFYIFLKKKRMIKLLQLMILMILFQKFQFLKIYQSYPEENQEKQLSYVI